MNKSKIQTACADAWHSITTTTTTTQQNKMYNVANATRHKSFIALFSKRLQNIEVKQYTVSASKAYNLQK